MTSLSCSQPDAHTTSSTGSSSSTLCYRMLAGTRRTNEIQRICSPLKVGRLSVTFAQCQLNIDKRLSSCIHPSLLWSFPNLREYLSLGSDIHYNFKSMQRSLCRGAFSPFVTRERAPVHLHGWSRQCLVLLFPQRDSSFWQCNPTPIHISSLARHLARVPQERRSCLSFPSS